MSTTTDLQTALEAILREKLPAAIALVKKKDAKVERSTLERVTEALGKFGIAAHILPPLPIEALPGGPQVFFSRVEIRVRIVEAVAVNRTGIDAYQAWDMVACALHWTAPEKDGVPMLEHPLQLAERCSEMSEDNRHRVLDCIFQAQLSLLPDVVLAGE